MVSNLGQGRRTVDTATRLHNFAPSRQVSITEVLAPRLHCTQVMLRTIKEEDRYEVGIVGAGAVGSACFLSMVMREVRARSAS